MDPNNTIRIDHNGNQIPQQPQQPQQGFNQGYQQPGYQQPSYQQPSYQQHYQQPQYQSQYPSQEMYYEEEMPTQGSGKSVFSLVGGIIAFVVSYISAILAMIGLDEYRRSSGEEMAITSLVVSIACLILSIFTLIAGIKGKKSVSPGKAITGMVFSIQNIISFVVIIIMAIVALVMHNDYVSSSYYYYYGY